MSSGPERFILFEYTTNNGFNKLDNSLLKHNNKTYAILID